MLLLLVLSRLEEKVNNLESENQVLRQQAVSMAPSKFLSGRSRSILQVVPQKFEKRPKFLASLSHELKHFLLYMIGREVVKVAI